MAKQTNIFKTSENKNSQEKKVVIKINSQSKKNNIDQINKKIKKIQLLEDKFKKAEGELTRIKEAYNKFIKPNESIVNETKEAFVNKLFKRWNEKGFTKWQKELFETIIMNECNYLFDQEYETENLKEIHKTILNYQKEQMNPFEKEMLNEIAKDILNDFGIDVEDDFEMDNFNPENNDYFEKFNQQRAQEEKKETEHFKKEKILNTDKQFQKLYKLLVKKTHPDLVICPKEKEAREDIMKRLSQVWEERNYYELLLLKAEIEQDNESEISIDEIQSKSLIKQLNAKINEWESKTIFLKKFDEENNFYFENFSFRTENMLNQKIHKYNEYLVEELEQTKNYLNNLKSKASSKAFLVNSRTAYENDDDFIFPIFE